MTERCPHCGSLVSVNTDEEGTSCYVSVPEQAIREALDILRPPSGEQVTHMSFVPLHRLTKILRRGLGEDSP